MRKTEEMRVAREKVVEKRKEAGLRRIEAQRKQRDEERSDAKATKAQDHSNRLRQDRDKALIKIGNYQNQIDSYTTQIIYFEKRIDLLHNRIKAQLRYIRTK